VNVERRAVEEITGVVSQSSCEWLVTNLHHTHVK